MNLDRVLYEAGVLPLISTGSGERIRGAALALQRAGLNCVEVTLRWDGAIEAIKSLTELDPGLKVGAGTVVTAEQADQAIKAGAQFVVSPGFNPRVVDRVRSRGIPMLPGIATPTELELAMARGFGLVKVFPAAHLGGVGYLGALSAAYPPMRYVPTGGVSESNCADFLALSCVTAVAGSWVADAASIADADYDLIERRARGAVAIVERCRRNES